MVVNYFGDGCFRLENGPVSLLVDPNNNRLKADVVLRTLAPAEDDISAEENPTPNEINFPGEYELKGFSIRGWQVAPESTEKFLKSVYLVEFEDMKFVFLGHLSEPLADTDILEGITEPDILFVPAGGGHFLEPADAVKLAKKLEPKVIIPSFIKNPAEFLKAAGQKAEAQDKFVFKKKDLEEMKGQAVILKSS